MFGVGLPELIIILIILAIPAAIIIGIILIVRLSADKSGKDLRHVFCTTCGTKNSGSASHCFRCGNILLRPQHNGKGISVGGVVPNYLAQAILATVFCCVPFGIPAIVFAAQVNSKLEGGDYAGAVEASKRAKLWCWISFGVGLGIVVVYLVFGLIGVLMEGRY
ncbi:MAG: CD225/dispanin family protein [Deltaproteobacteria bacterium]|nr:CD225/dispanin family protein [Deltaproteobacteria bacterium]